MEIKLNEQEIQKVIEESVSKSVQQAISGYEVKDMIEKSLANTFLSQTLGEAVKNAVNSVDLMKMTVSISMEIEKTLAKASTCLIQEAFVDVVCKLRGITDYGNNSKEEKNRIRCEMFNQKKEA